MASKGRPYRTTTFGGFTILVGKGAADNDVLSLQIAEPGDLWLHVGGGTPGSHVVVQNPGGSEIPYEVLEHAAKLAAWYSKARSPRPVRVDYCLAARVRKPRGAPPGLVEISGHRSLNVVGEPIEAQAPTAGSE